MQLPRMTIRRWVVVVVIVAAAMSAWRLRRLSQRYSTIAAFQRQQQGYADRARNPLPKAIDRFEVEGRRFAEAARTAGNQREARFMRDEAARLAGLAETYREWVRDFTELSDYRAQLRRKYEQAATYPWLPVDPDPPEPERIP
jgi:hypothetical protein